MKKTLGINISHNVSFSYFENDVLKKYYEEDRFNKIKNFYPPHPFLDKEYEYIVLKKFKNITFDLVSFVTSGKGDITLETEIIKIFLKQIKFKNLKFFSNEHHVFHALSGFYFSNFNEAVCLISDGGGELYPKTIDLKALESIYYIINKTITKFYQHYSTAYNDYFRIYHKIPTHLKFKKNNIDYKLSNNVVAGVKYRNYSEEAGFSEFEAGQLMGVAAYKNKNTNINKNIINIANKAQEETLEERIELIKKAQTYSNCKNIILSGGYHLNCSNNFKLVKYFPKLNFFVDPICYDGGTAVGVAYGNIKYEKDFKN